MCYLKRVTWNVRKYAQEFILGKRGKKKPTDYVEKEIEEKNKSACYLKPYKSSPFSILALKCLLRIKPRYAG